MSLIHEKLREQLEKLPQSHLINLLEAVAAEYYFENEQTLMQALMSTLNATRKAHGHWESMSDEHIFEMTRKPMVDENDMAELYDLWEEEDPGFDEEDDDGQET